MDRTRRVKALTRCLLRQGNEEDSLAEVLAQWVPATYTPAPETDQAAGESELQFTAWRKVWKRIELRDLGGFA